MKGNEMSTTKAYKGIAMEGVIATWYAKNARRDEEFKRYARLVSEAAPAGSRVLEVAPGPGYLSIELAKPGKYQVTGLDISKTFVDIARTNARQASVQVDFRYGNASDMPFVDETFDFIICTAAFKNFTRPVRAIAEMYRVLRSDGTALIVDLRRDASRAAVNQMVDEMGLNRVNTLFTKWAFKGMLLKNAHTPDEIRRFVSQTSFQECDIHADAVGMEIWLRK
jgi:ubiquinone/menaquinone biosynthesis C-methylase UbiE